MEITKTRRRNKIDTDHDKSQNQGRSPGLFHLFALWLNQPFMFPSSVLARFLISFSFGFFVFLFLRIFLPFGLGSIPVNKTAFISVYGILTTLVISIWLFVFPLFSPGMFEPENYTIRRYLILCFGNTMLVNIMNWIYTRTAGADFLPHYGFLPFTLFTFSVGVFPVVFLTLVIDKTILKIKTRNAIMMQVIKPEINDQEQKPEEFIIRNSAGATHLHFSGQDFICARSNENYTQIYYRENNSVRKELVRIPIARFYEQVKEGAHIVRCHRSGVVNLKYIKHITGKSRSLELSLDHVDEPVPVSRDFPRSLLYSPLRSR